MKPLPNQDDAVAVALASAEPVRAITLIRGCDLVASPWKNGGGVTREIAVHPSGAPLDAFLWRASVADVSRTGPFSSFPGIDRTFVLLCGAGMLLDETSGAGSAHRHALTRPLDILRFAGEAAINAQPVAGTTRDFNLMVKRGAASSEIEMWDGGTQRVLATDIVLLHCVAGPVAITLDDAAPVVCAAGDTLRIDAAHGLRCSVSPIGGPLADPPVAGAVVLLAVMIRCVSSPACG